MFQKNKTSGKKNPFIYISNSPDKEFKEIVKILKRPTRRMDEHSKLQQREYISIEQK